MTPMTLPGRDPRTRRHSTATVLLARRMYADGEGWTPTEIVRYLEAQGTPVALMTIRRWVVPGTEEEERQRNNFSYRRRQARAARNVEPTFELPESGVRYQREFMERLLAEGVPCASIARCCQVVFGGRFTAAEVRDILRDLLPVHGNIGKGRPRSKARAA